MTLHKYLKTRCLLQIIETRSELQKPIDEYFAGKEVTVFCENSKQQQHCIALFGRIQNCCFSNKINLQSHTAT